MKTNGPMLFRPVLTLIAAAIAFASCAPTTELPRAEYPRTPRSVAGTPAVLFVSDTQAPLLPERMFLKSDDNETATRLLFEAAARESTCAAMFHLGDITPLGGVSSYWEEFDERSRPLREAGIPLFPAFGNHEYMEWDEGGIYNMLVRFPFLRPSWYQRRIGPLAVVILNSNFPKLSTEEEAEQESWLAKTLEALDADTSVTAVVVGCHHSPYTNSTIVSPSEEVQRRFVPLFLKTSKARLFLSGHAHALEHFSREGKDFLVIGGGGGLLHPLLMGEAARWPDSIPRETNRSYFHYVRLTPGPAGLSVDVEMLAPDFTGFRTAYSFHIP